MAPADDPRPASPGANDPLGSVVSGRYRIDALLGRGGMASVYRAHDLELGRDVALKLFRTDVAEADDVRRQRDEVRLLASLNAPNLVTLFDAFLVDDDRRLVVVLELVPGADLGRRLKSGPLPADDVAAIGRDVASALSAAHLAGIVHRDVKPANILVIDGAQGLPPQAKLADFGIARLTDDTRLTATGTTIGTATYFSPEQALGHTPAPPSDVYALGLVLLEALTGVVAFPGAPMQAALARLSRDPEIPDTFGPAWTGLLTAMTARAAEDRPDAAVVAAALAPLVADPPIGRDVFTTPLPATAVFVGDDDTVAVRRSRAEALPPTAAETVAAPLSADDAPRHRGRVAGLIAGSLALVAAIVVVAALAFAPQQDADAGNGAPASASATPTSRATHTATSNTKKSGTKTSKNAGTTSTQPAVEPSTADEPAATPTDADSGATTQEKTDKAVKEAQRKQDQIDRGAAKQQRKADKAAEKGGLSGSSGKGHGNK